MGALTSNRKRGDDYFSLNRNTASSPDWCHPFDNHVSKKPKVSFTHDGLRSPDRPVSSTSTVSRFFRYPERTQPLPREVHAPCRTNRPFWACSTREPRVKASAYSEREEQKINEMGNALSYNYQAAKNLAFSAFRYTKKDDVDAEVGNDEVFDDSSVEELQGVEDGRGGRSVGRSPERNDGVVTNVQELDAKNVEHRLQPSSSSMVSDLTNGDLKVANAGLMLDALSLNPDEDVDGEPVHQKLFKSAERRDSKLKDLSFKITYLEKLRSRLTLFSPVKKPEKKKPEKDVLSEAFVPLTKEDDVVVSKGFSANRRKVLITHENSNIEITGEKFQCLRPGAWLNDEVINVYFELLKEREKREPKKFLKCHFFSTFFYKKLISGRDGYDYKSVRRWTTQRKLGYCLLECDKIFVPIHKEIHWCLAVISKNDEKFQYLDSLKGRDSKVLKVLARYLVDEVKDKSGTEIDVSSWEQEYVEELPEQENGSDCGMFMIKYADFYSRGGGLHFSQENMPYFRRRTAKEILQLKAE